MRRIAIHSKLGTLTVDFHRYNFTDNILSRQRVSYTNVLLLEMGKGPKQPPLKDVIGPGQALGFRASNIAMFIFLNIIWLI